MALAKAEILQMVKKLVSPPKLGKYSLLSEPYSTDQKKPNSERERIQNRYENANGTGTERIQNGYRTDVERIRNSNKGKSVLYKRTRSSEHMLVSYTIRYQGAHPNLKTIQF